MPSCFFFIRPVLFASYDIRYGKLSFSTAPLERADNNFLLWDYSFRRERKRISRLLETGLLNDFRNCENAGNCHLATLLQK